MSTGSIVRLVSNAAMAPDKETLAAWLRSLADEIEQDKFEGVKRVTCLIDVGHTVIEETGGEPLTIREFVGMLEFAKARAVREVIGA